MTVGQLNMVGNAAAEILEPQVARAYAACTGSYDHEPIVYAAASTDLGETAPFCELHALGKKAQLTTDGETIKVRLYVFKTREEHFFDIDASDFDQEALGLQIAKLLRKRKFN